MRLQNSYPAMRTIAVYAIHLAASKIPCLYAFGLPIRICSLQAISGPLIGYYHTTILLCILYCGKAALLSMSSATLSWYTYISVYHIPTLCGAFYTEHIASTRSPSIVYRLGIAAVPLCCILYFITDSIGSQSWLYSTPWLIPLCSALIPHRSIGIHALASTLIMHSVGSIIWLATHTTTAEFWLALFPVACAERILIASGITLLIYLITALESIYARPSKIASPRTPIQQQGNLL